MTAAEKRLSQTEPGQVGKHEKVCSSEEGETDARVQDSGRWLSQPEIGEVGKHEKVCSFEGGRENRCQSTRLRSGEVGWI